MNKLTNIRIKYDDGTYSDDIPIQVLANNIYWTQELPISLTDILGQVKYTSKGSIQHQLDNFSLEEIENARIGINDIVYDNVKDRLDNEYQSLENAISVITTNLQNQTNTRLNTDTAIRTDLESEISTRINNNNLLSSQIASLSTKINNIENKVEDEINTRENEDDILQDNISSEANIRAIADQSLQTQINNIIQNIPEEQNSKLDNLIINSLVESSINFPTPAIGDNGSIIFGKIIKWFNDMRSLVSQKLNINAVINNLTTTTEGYALDARQGKILKDLITTMGTPLYFSVAQRMTASTINISDIINTTTIQPGVYLITASIAFGGTDADGKITQLQLYDEVKDTQIINFYPFTKCFTFTAFYTVTQETRLIIRGKAAQENTSIFKDTFNYLRLLKIK